jgi:hypothetical protein
MTLLPSVGTGEMVVTFDQGLKESQLPLDHLHKMKTMWSDTITIATEGTEATDDDMCASTSAPSSDEDSTVHSETLEEEQVKVVELEDMPPQEESSSAKDDPKLLTTKRRTSILKPYNAADIPVRDKKCYWKQLPKPNLEEIRANSVPAPILISDVTRDALENCRKSGGVRFHVIQVREYEQTMGDNPSVSYGTPISLDWEYEELEPVDLEVYEATRGPRRPMRQMILNYYKRRNILTWRCGFSEEELKVAQSEATKTRRARAMTKALLPAQIMEEVMQSVARKTKRFTQRRQSPAA